MRETLSQLAIEGDGLSYLSLETLSPAAFDLLQLRDTFGLRSSINTVLRVWNPSGARASVQGVFHPFYRGFQSRAAALLGDRTLTVIKGGGGEFERNPAKEIVLFGLRDGVELNETAPALLRDTRRLHDPSQPSDLPAFWSGSQDDPFATDTVIGTAALAHWTLGASATAAGVTEMANALWINRHTKTRKIA